MTAKTVKLGPGTLKIGPTVSALDVSCQMLNAVVAWEADTEDDLKVLCGDTVPGARTYTSTISGTLLEDLTVDGIVEYSWDNKGTEQQIEYVPNTENAAKVTGTIIIDPLDVGSTEDYGTPMQSDFEWTFVGEPVLALTAVFAAESSSEATNRETVDA